MLMDTKRTMFMIVNGIYFFAFLVVLTEGESKSHRGKYFIAAFSKNIDLRSIDVYFLLSSAMTDTNCSAKFFTSGHLAAESHFNLNHTNVKTLSMFEHIGNSSVQFPLVVIQSTNDVEITAFVSGSMSSASYLVLPVELAGNEYRMMPFCLPGKGLCMCSIVTTKPNTTISVLNSKHGEISIHTMDYIIGKNTSDHLSGLTTSVTFMEQNQLRLISVESKKDFSGLLVKTSEPVVVFCGGSVSGAVMSLEQIPPVEYFGLSFYPLTTVYSMPPSKIRIIIHFNCTDVTMGLNKKVNLRGGDVIDLQTKFLVLTKIVATKPIALVQIFNGPMTKKVKGSKNKKGKSYVESMVFVPSIDQYPDLSVIPKHSKKGLYMVVSMVSILKYTTINNNKEKVHKTPSNGVFVRSDAGGTKIMVFFDCRQPFLISTFRHKSNYEGDAFVSLPGYSFISRTVKNYSSESCKQNVRHDSKTMSAKYASPAMTSDTTVVSSIGTSTENFSREMSTVETSTSVAAQEYTSMNFEDKGMVTPPISSTEPDITSSSSQELTTDPRQELSSHTSTTRTVQSIQQFKHNIELVVHGQCLCNMSDSLRSTSHEKINEKISKIRRELTIDKSVLSASKRKKISVADGRVSARGIGIVGASILCGVISVIVVLDVPTISQHVTILWRNTVGRGIYACRQCMNGNA